MSRVMTKLVLCLVALVAPILSGAAETRAEPRAAPVATPEPGNPQRKTLLDALRDEIKRRQGRDVVFVVRSLKVSDGWAWLNAFAQSSDGRRPYGDVTVLLEQRGDAWQVRELACQDANLARCAGNPRFIAGLKQRFPAAPQALFADDESRTLATRIESRGSVANFSPPAAGLVIEFDREFRGLPVQPRALPESKPIIAEPDKVAERGDTRLRATTNTVQQLATNQQELMAKLTELEDALKRQRQTTSQTQSARHALVSSFAAMDEKVSALAKSLETIRSSQQTPESSLTDLREELDAQGETAARLASYVSEFQSKLDAIGTQVGELHSAQQELLAGVPAAQRQPGEHPAPDHAQLRSIEQSLQALQADGERYATELSAISAEVKTQAQAFAEASAARDALVDQLAAKTRVAEIAASQEQVGEAQTAAQAQLQSIQESLQALQADRQGLASQLNEMGAELSSQAQSLVQSNAARDALVAQLATKTRVAEIAAAQQQVGDTQTATQAQLQSIQESLQALQADRQGLASQLNEMGAELNSQGQTLARLNTARDALVAELAPKTRVEAIAAAQQQVTDAQAATHMRLQSIEETLHALRAGDQNFTSKLNELNQRLTNQRGADAQSSAPRKAIVDELSSLRNQISITDKTIKAEQADRKKLSAELVTVQQQIEKQADAAAKSAAENAALRAELASINDQSKALQQTQQNTIQQTTQSQQQLRQQLGALHAELSTIAKSLQPTADETQDLISDVVAKMTQQLEQQRQLIGQADTDRSVLASELSSIRKQLSALDAAERVARADRDELSAEVAILNAQFASGTDVNARAGSQSTRTRTGSAGRQIAKKTSQGGAGAQTKQRQVVAATSPAARPGDQRRIDGNTQSPGAGGTWKITPAPEGSDRKYTHRASGTITRLPPGAAGGGVSNPSPTPGEISSGGNDTGRPPDIIGAIDLPVGSEPPPGVSQLASAAAIQANRDLNIMSDFDALDPFLQAWIEDWERKDLEAYLAHYSRDFEPPGNLNLAAWRDQRRNSLLKPSFIDVEIKNIRRQSTGAASAQLTFNQVYRSNLYNDQVLKTLVLRWEDERWKIVKEESRSKN